MNLQFKHFPFILLGAAMGSVIGWIISYWIKPGIMPEMERAVGVQALWSIWGGVAGLACTAIRLLSRSIKDPHAELPKTWTQINGIGSGLFGKTEEHEDGSYIATEWFTVLWIPVFPICRYRVTKQGGSLFNRYYKVHAKYPFRAKDSLRMYIIAVVLVCVAVGVLYTLTN
jgi:hypothetical protein